LEGCIRVKEGSAGLPWTSIVLHCKETLSGPWTEEISRKVALSVSSPAGEEAGAIYRKPVSREPRLERFGDNVLGGTTFWGQEDVKKSIWPKYELMQNVCRRPSDRLLGILARFFLEPKFRHTDFSISSHLPDELTPILRVEGNKRDVH
jgi:hypothetical protein